MRLLAIGDIHGHLQALHSLLDAHEFSPEDTIVFLGDYVDKGPDVAGVLDFLSELSANENFIFLRGNHDQMLIDAYRDPNKILLWECLAGDDPLRSYGTGSSKDLLQQIPEAHIKFLEERCQDYYENSEFIFVHGGTQFHLSPSEDDQDHMHWLTLSTAAAHHSGRTVICGHSAQESGRIVDLGHTICIDTGITKGKFITCLDTSDFSFVQSSQCGAISEGLLQRSSV
jgi:serine/threonine protein phosphatase 1